MASVGKLFTATLIGLLKDEDILDFDDHVHKFLDKDIMHHLHVYKETDYSGALTIRHLLMHTSGLADGFWDLVGTMYEDRGFMQPRDLVGYVKNKKRPKTPPGKKVAYADTNYYLLGLVIESVTGKTFQEVMHERLFQPLEMDRSWLINQSEPKIKSDGVVPFMIGGIEGNRYDHYGSIDYAGGSVIGPLQDMNRFMKAFAHDDLLKPETKEAMIENPRFLYPGIGYGMGVWVLKAPFYDFSKVRQAYGVFGATGSFLIYHPKTRSVISGSFNHEAYQITSVRFVMKVIKILLEV